MARHASPQNPTAQRALVALATVGVALGAGAATASANAEPVVPGVRTSPTSVGDIDPQAGLQALTGVVGHVTGPVTGLKPNPLAGTGVDPLDNGVGTQLTGFKPLTSQALTQPVAQAQSIGSMPVIGQAAGLLGG
ncbi:hypothetical protein [Streptomyces sp. ALI-76-A]|uniref:hypothetical protein n=1 Tax=Streptomyces sp. ALI-76-A TaxID=3025736 RepID=UPI00256F18C6|nr:hypothetical protein [Streptomyces sp. ALI-76-A]MDL5203458.1 hypothetical protein [Streptomyces sp. ALI-76-A]